MPGRIFGADIDYRQCRRRAMMPLRMIVPAIYHAEDYIALSIDADFGFT